MSAALERVIACQERLIEALDGRDPNAIEEATVALADALAPFAGQGAVHDIQPVRVDHALRQTHAARIRVNVLSDWTRQRIDRLGEIRSGSAATYGNKGISPPTS